MTAETAILVVDDAELTRLRSTLPAITQGTSAIPAPRRLQAAQA